MRKLTWASILCAAMCSCSGGSGTGSQLPESDGGHDAIVDSGFVDGDSGLDGGDASAETNPATWPIIVQFGPDLAEPVRHRILEHLGQASAGRPIEERDAAAPLATLSPAWLILGFGETSSTRSLVTESDVVSAGSEGYVIRSGTVAGSNALVVDGNAAEGSKAATDIGTAHGALAALEELGFAFLHPLAPTVPAALGLPGALNQTEHPYWPVRGLQLHTMHPLELTDLVQGWGQGGPDDAAGWESMLPEWDRFLEWLLANGQNRFHWVLLYDDAWKDFADSTVRLERLGKLVARAHAFGLQVGVDAQIAMVQQHAYRFIRQTGELPDELSQIRDRIDWLMGAGFDYLATESGTTEFTHPDDERMVAWMNEAAVHMDEVHGKQTLIKIHCSTGQTADSYTDPETNEPLNFNWLPHYADPRLGVMPHTVQHYALDDKAPTYGNEDFGYMRRFVQLEAGARTTVWHPETAYWVSFDNDVPLFLPLYAERRLRDLRLLAADEQAGKMGRGAHEGSRMDGQITFSSGWEWGYWLQDVVTARAAWNPRTEVGDEQTALRALLRPVVRPFGSAAKKAEDLLVELVVMQNALLIRGEVGGVAPSTPVRRNGQAYLQGVETWDDVADLAKEIPGVPAPVTQPDRLGLVEMRNPLHESPSYSQEVEPLLAAMSQQFDAWATEFEALRPEIPAHAMPLFDELADAARITALRARQVHGLYDYVDGWLTKPDAWRQQRLQEARDALDDALVIVAEREKAYRVPAFRIAGWRPNPAAYRFTYLWTVSTLFYWWRDEAKAVEAPVSPCYLNVIDPAEVGMGEGTVVDAAALLDKLGDAFPSLGSLAACAAAPDQPPLLPPAGLRP